MSAEASDGHGPRLGRFVTLLEGDQAVGSSRHLAVGGDSATAAILYAALAALSVSDSSPKRPRGGPREADTAVLLLARVARVGRHARDALARPRHAVIATLGVFERWIKAIPGGLVAVVSAIAVSWAFDLSTHGVSVLGPVPSGLPEIGLPSGRRLGATCRCCAPQRYRRTPISSGVASPTSPRA